MVNQGSSLPLKRATKQSSSSEGSCSESLKSSNVKVVVRVRPLNAAECLGNHKNVVRVMDDRVVVFDPQEDEDTSFIPSKRPRTRSNILDRRVKDLRFIFDRVFDETSSNQDIFDHTTKSIIDGVLNGYNCTVFAYGATGAGKTHTMLGNGDTPGVMFLTMMELYSRIEEMKEEKTCEVAVSYLEVYNETIRDLLMPGKQLAVREDPHRGVCISGLTLHQPRSAEELFGMLEYGNRNRSQHPTDANATSSRSHAVFQVFVRQKSNACGLKADIQVAKMSLIDLAGSERATATKNRGARFREGANINKSLLALGNCINALAENQGKNLHIPYRNSKLTRILKDSLGGNCRTVMIAAISSCSLSYEDTYNTLKYADRAKSIKSTLVKNVISVDRHVSQYAKLVKELQEEVARLKDKLKRFESGEATPLKKNIVETRKKEEMEKLKSEMKTVYSERSEIKKNLVDTECVEKELMEKLHRKQKNVEWMNLLCHDESKTSKVHTRVRKCLSATKSRLKHLKERKEKLDEQLQENDNWLRRTQNEVKMVDNDVGSSTSSCTTQTFFTVYETSCSNELRTKELQQECKYYKKCVRNYETQRKREKRLIDALLKFVKKQFVVLKASGMATSEINEDYENIVNIVEDNREVVWADQTTLKPEKEYAEPMDVIKMMDSNLSFISTDQTPLRTPVKPKLTTCSIDLTPRRVKTPTLTLSSTLQPPKKDPLSPFVFAAPSAGQISATKTSTTATATNKTTSECSVRQNLLDVLNRNESTCTTSSAVSSKNTEVKICSGAPSFQFKATRSTRESGEAQEFRKPTSVLSTQTEPAFVFSKRPSLIGKAFHSKPTAVVNKNVGPPLREQNNSNIQTTLTNNNQTMTDTSIQRQKANTTFGMENGRKVPSYASLTKSAAQKMTSRNMLPKRSHAKENTIPQPKRRKLPRSVSSNSLLTDHHSKKRDQHKNHISGLRRAVSVLHMRK